MDRAADDLAHLATGPVLPGAVRVVAVLRAADFRDALKAAGIVWRPGDDTLSKADEMVGRVAQRAVSTPLQRSLPDIRLISDELREFETACARVSRALNRRLGGPMSDEDLPGALANLLTLRCDPLVQALRDAMSVRANDDSALLQGLLILDRLGGAAGAARKQFEQGLARERASGKDAAARSPMRELGFALIDTWVAFTGKPPRFSRPSDGGAPSGPLIRYLICLFARARNNLAAHPERHELAPERGWSPAPETLAAWIRQHRRTA